MLKPASRPIATVFFLIESPGARTRARGLQCFPQMHWICVSWMRQTGLFWQGFPCTLPKVSMQVPAWCGSRIFTLRAGIVECCNGSRSLRTYWLYIMAIYLSGVVGYIQGLQSDVSTPGQRWSSVRSRQITKSVFQCPFYTIPHLYHKLLANNEKLPFLCQKQIVYMEKNEWCISKCIRNHPFFELTCAPCMWAQPHMHHFLSFCLFAWPKIRAEQNTLVLLLLCQEVQETVRLFQFDTDFNGTLIWAQEVFNSWH